MYNRSGNNFLPHQGFNNPYNYNTQNFAYFRPRMNRYPYQYSVTSYPPPSVIQTPSYPTSRLPMFVQNMPYDIMKPDHGTVHYDVSTYDYSANGYYPSTVPHFSNGFSSTNVPLIHQQNLSELSCSSHQQNMFEPLPKATQHQRGKVKNVTVVKEQRNTSKKQGKIERVPSHKCKSVSVPNCSSTESNNEKNASEGENFGGSILASTELTAREKDSKIPDKRNMLNNNKEMVHREEIDTFNKPVNFNEEHIYARNKSKILNTVSNNQANTCDMHDYYTQKFQSPALQNNQPLNENLLNDPRVKCLNTLSEYSNSDNFSSNLFSSPALDNRFDSEIISDQLFVSTSKFVQIQIPSNHGYKESKIEGMGEFSQKFSTLAMKELDFTSSSSRTHCAKYNSNNSVRQCWNENAKYDQSSQRRRISNNMTMPLSYNAHIVDPLTTSSASQTSTSGKTVHPSGGCHTATESSFGQSKQTFENSLQSQIILNSAKDRSKISSNSLDAFYTLRLLNEPLSISKESLLKMTRYQEIISNDLKQNKRPSKTENLISYTSLPQAIENVSSLETNSRSSERETSSSNMSQGTYRQASFKQSSLDILLDESKLIIHSYINDTPRL